MHETDCTPRELYRQAMDMTTEIEGKIVRRL